MDEDRDDLDDFDDGNMLDDATDESVPDGHVVMPDGSCLCLCGRDPRSGTVIMEIAKAVALLLEYDLCLDGCVRDAAASYDSIHRDLKMGAATSLCDRMLATRQIIETLVTVDADEEALIVTGSQVRH